MSEYYRELIEEAKRFCEKSKEIINDKYGDEEARELVGDIRNKILELEEEKQSIIAFSTWDNMRMEEREEIEYEVDNYLEMEEIDIKRYYIYASQNDDVEYYEELWQLERYIEAYVSCVRHGRIGVGIEYIKGNVEFGATDLIAMNKYNGETKFSWTDNVEKLQIRLSKELREAFNKFID